MRPEHAHLDKGRAHIHEKEAMGRRGIRMAIGETPSQLRIALHLYTNCTMLSPTTCVYMHTLQHGDLFTPEVGPNNY